MDKLAQWHKAACALLDVTERNVLRSENGRDFRLIDLEYVKNRHVCTLETTYNFLEAKEDSLVREELAQMCLDLRNAAAIGIVFWAASELLHSLDLHLSIRCAYSLLKMLSI